LPLWREKSSPYFLMQIFEPILNLLLIVGLL
jgi:hypothetical protein